MSDYWYENRHRLNCGDVCILDDGSIVKLKDRVEGDGTDWYVYDWSESYVDGEFPWYDEDRRIHPSEIEKGPAW